MTAFPCLCWSRWLVRRVATIYGTARSLKAVLLEAAKGRAGVDSDVVQSRLITVVGEGNRVMSTRGKFAVGSGIIIVTLLSLAYAGFTQSKTYYHTLSELPTLQGMALHQRMRIGGNVRAGSIQHLAGRVDFVLEEQGRTLPVSYAGRDPLPDTFKDGAQALVEGNLMPDGRFVAEQSTGEMRIEV